MSKMFKIVSQLSSRAERSHAGKRNHRRERIGGNRRRQLRSELLEPRQMLAGDFDVRFILTARDINTDELLPNIQGVTQMSENSDAVLQYKVPINEVFKLEVAVQDLRDRQTRHGIFRAVTDIIVESKGVLEPAIGEVQELVFSQDILTPANANGTIELFLDSAPSNKVTMSLNQFLGDGDSHVETQLKNAVAQLNSQVTSASQIRTLVTRKPEGGPGDGSAYIAEVIYSDPSFIGVNMPRLRANLTIDPEGPVGPTAQPVLQNEFNVYIDSDSDGQVDDINPDRMFHFFELYNRNVGIGNPPVFNQTRVYGQTRVVAGFDQSGASDIFDEVGGLGPVSNGGIRDAINPFSGDIAYDAFAIPVRGVSIANNVSVKLDPPDIGDKVLIYGTETNKEEVPANRIQLGGNSRFLLEVHEPLPEVNAQNTSRNLNEDAAAININLSTLVVADPGTLTYSLTSSTTLGASVLNGTTLTYTPTANLFGTETLSYRVTHESGQFDSGVITFQIAPVGDTPVAVSDSATTNEDTLLTILRSTLTANDNDVDPQDTLTIVSITPPSHGTAQLTANAITYNPVENYFGPDSITYTIRDSFGLESTATVNLTVTPVNDSPTAVGETAQTDPNTPLTFTFAELLANDSAGPLESNQALTISAVSAPVRPGSTAIISGNTIVYTPAPDLSAVDSFTYTVSDGQATTTAAVTIDVSFQIEPINLVLPASTASDITLRRSGSRLEVVDHTNNDALLLRRPLNTITSLTITGATTAANRVKIDHQSGGLITFIGTSATMDFVGGSTGNDELILIGNTVGTTNSNVLLAEANSGDTSMINGLIANLQSGSSSSGHDISGFEKVTIQNVGQVTVPTTSTLDVGAHELHLNSTGDVNLSNTTRVAGGKLTSTARLVLGANDTLSGSGTVEARIVSNGNSTIIANGPLTLGDTDFDSSIDIAGVLLTGGHTVALLDADAAVVRGRITLGDVAGAAGTVSSATGITIQSGGQISGNGSVATPNNVTAALLNSGSISGTSATAPITLTGWLTGAGVISNAVVAGTWNPSDAISNRIDGRVDFAGTAATLVDIGGVATTSYDRLRFNPGATLGGALEVELVNGFTPSVGHQFNIIESTNGLTGEFDGVIVPTLTDGLKWFIDQSANNFSLQVTLDSAALSDTVQVKLSATNQIIIVGSAGQDIPVAGNTFTLEVDPTTQRFESPQSWTVGPTQNTNGKLYQIATNGAATLRIAGAGWTNFINRFDPNRVGGVTAVDALVIINELNAPKYSTGLTSTLKDPNTVVDFPNVFYDVNGDGRVSAVDALQVINFLINQDNSVGQPLVAGEPLDDIAPVIQTSSGNNSLRNEILTELHAAITPAVQPVVATATDAVFADWSVARETNDTTTDPDAANNSLTDTLELLSNA